MSESEVKALELAIANLDRQFGKGTVVRLGDDSVEPWPAISTGALTLDLALGIGGLPRGRIVEIFGPESSGKTTVALNVIAESQKEGGRCAFIDVENALDPGYAQALGVNLDELLLSQPDYGEAALDVVLALIETGALSVIVIDSVAALLPKQELEGSMSDSHVGLQPRLMGQALRKMTSPARRNDTLVIFTNQLREKIGVFYGNPETQPGGRALKFYASVRIDVRRKEDLKNANGVMTGVKTRARVIKNKMAPPFKQCEFDIIWGQGIDSIGCILDISLEREIIVTKGSFYYYKGENIAQGRAKALDWLRADPESTSEIVNTINA